MFGEDLSLTPIITTTFGQRRKGTNGFHLIERVLAGGRQLVQGAEQPVWSVYQLRPRRALITAAYRPYDTGQAPGERRTDGREFDLVVDQRLACPIPSLLHGTATAADRSVGDTRDSSRGVHGARSDADYIMCARTVGPMRPYRNEAVAAAAAAVADGYHLLPYPPRAPALPCPCWRCCFCVDDDVNARRTVTNKIQHGRRTDGDAMAVRLIVRASTSQRIDYVTVWVTTNTQAALPRTLCVAGVAKSNDSPNY